MKRILFTAIIALSAAAMSAQTEIYTLEQCRQMAVDNNADVKIAQGKARAAEELRREAFTKYFPTVEATGMAFRTSRPMFSYEFFDFVTIKMIRGGIGASITAVQPVFAGGRIVNGNKLAAVGVEAGRLQSENAADDARVTAEKYYWQLFTLKSKKQTLTKVLAMLDTLNRQVTSAVNAGVVLRNDLLKVELKQNQYRADMVDLDNGIALSRKLLAQYIGRDGADIDIDAPALPDEVPPFPADLYVDNETALPTTADYRLLEQQQKAAELEKRIALGNNLPTVGVGAGYFYDDVISQKNHFGAVFVSVNIPISSWWGGSKELKRKSIDVENARLQKDNLSQMLKLSMTNAWDDLTAAHRKMAIAHESIGQSAENLRLNQNFYDAGVSTITDLLDAQTLYQQALDDYADAFGNFCLKRAVYLDATGRS